MIILYDKKFNPLISSLEINFAIEQLVRLIEDDFVEETPVFISVLNGAFMFVSDFMKHYKGNCELSFVKLKSYQGTSNKNEIDELIGLDIDLTGRSVIIMEDIVDTGNTLMVLKSLIKTKAIKRLKIATLFFKPTACKHNIKLDYVGITIPNKFIVGYGLDYKGLGRNLTEIYQIID